MKFALFIWSLCLPIGMLAQDSSTRQKKTDWSGYLKDLRWLRFDKKFKEAYATDLLHNRVNFKWKPVANLEGRIEIRNRLFRGDDVSGIAGFREQLRNANELTDLSVTWFSKRAVILHSNIERLWLEYRKARWSARAGRQRINWGMATTWNPNDLFNTYNFLDFDYEERPGSDAVRFQYQPGELSNLELAYAATSGRPVAAAKFSTNYRGYDLQLLAGVYYGDFTAGLGWAGSISDVGFKGEMQWYPGKDSLSNLCIATEADYIFKSGLYTSIGVLYNQAGLTKPSQDPEKLILVVSPRSLMPGKWNIVFTGSREFTPRLNARASIVYSPGTNLLILFPSCSYNLATNIDLGFYWQSFFLETKGFGALSHTAFLRLKWNF
jgi:hypothetical protein